MIEEGQHDNAVVTSGAYLAGFGEPLEHTLDVDTWKTGEDLADIYRRIDREVREAVSSEEAHRVHVRHTVFPQLGRFPGAAPGAGVYQIHADALTHIHRGLLFNGGCEACDGRILSHDSLPLTIFQVGVSLVSYQGHQGTWNHRLFRRDLRVSGGDPAEEAIDLLERRLERDGLNRNSSRDALTHLARQGIMAYAERAILLRRSSAPWRMGHGNPAPFELVTGSGSADLMIEGTRLIRDLVEGHQKFVFVSSEPAQRVLLTIGQALRPLEYAIVHDLRQSLANMIGFAQVSSRAVSVDTSWDGHHLTPYEWLRRFQSEVAPQVVVGVYRATRMAPPQVFYAHAEHAELAAHIAVADSVLQAHRGFPLLIDLADSVCRGVFGRETLDAPINSAYIDAGAPFKYVSERQTRYR